MVTEVVIVPDGNNFVVKKANAEVDFDRINISNRPFLTSFETANRFATREEAETWCTQHGLTVLDT